MTIDRGPSRELPTLTPLRGIAALAVVAYHAQLIADREGFTLFEGVLRDAAVNGYLFVDLFFVLSGFVIAYVYGRRIPQGSSGYASFLARRLGRIYPLHLAIVAAAVIPHAVGYLSGSPHAFASAHSGRALVTELLLLDSIGIHEQLTWNEMSWSVSAEWLSYLLAPALLATAAWRPDNRWLAPAGVVLCWIGLYALAPDGDLGAHTFELGAVRGILGFASGVALHRVHGHMTGRWSSRATSAFVGAGLVVAIVLTLDLHDVVALPAFSVLVLAGVRLQGPAAEALNCRPLTRLGDISYSVYLIQYLFLGGLLTVIRTVGVERIDALPALLRYGALLVFMAMIIGASALTYRRIEVPARDLVRSRLAPSAAGEPVPSAVTA